MGPPGRPKGEYRKAQPEGTSVSPPEAGGVAAYAIKAAIDDPGAATFEFPRAKTMYGGKRIAAGDTIYLFHSENAGGHGLIARAVVVAAQALPLRPGVERQTPCVSLRVRRVADARRPLGRVELKPFAGRPADEGPEAELHFKFYRQATDKVVGLGEAAAAFLMEACR